jgi:NTE family protein
MNMLGIVTKMTISRTLLLQLKDAGRAAMDRFLAEKRQLLGKRSSVDLRRMFSSEGSVV